MYFPAPNIWLWNSVGVFAEFPPQNWLGSCWSRWYHWIPSNPSCSFCSGFELWLYSMLQSCINKYKLQCFMNLFFTLWWTKSNGKHSLPPLILELFPETGTHIIFFPTARLFDFLRRSICSQILTFAKSSTSCRLLRVFYIYIWFCIYKLFSFTLHIQSVLILIMIIVTVTVTILILILRAGKV